MLFRKLARDQSNEDESSGCQQCRGVIILDYAHDNPLRADCYNKKTEKSSYRYHAFQYNSNSYLIVLRLKQIIDLHHNTFINLAHNIIINLMIETRATILCALCGIKFTPTMGSICPTCTIKSLEEEKFLEGTDINYCRYCQRFERPPWINCERESQQMLTILLKKVKGLNKVDVQSASFIWTEPHSKRMKIKVVFNREVNEGMRVEVTQVVEFVEKYTQCPDCKKKFTPHDWIALVQLRQQAKHKRTIHNLEQVLLKQKLLDKIVKTEQVEGGVDIFFSTQNDATRLIDFLKGRFPLSIKTSSKLISHNERENTSNVKITHSCLLPKICKDDLVHIPRKLSKQLGSCCEVLLCVKVSSCLHFLDLATFRKVQISAHQYNLYQNQIETYNLKSYGKKFTVLDCEVKDAETPQKHPSFGITFMKENEYVELYTKCHFKEETGNELAGYELSQIENIAQVSKIPDFVMVHKIKDKEMKKKLKSIKRKKEAEARRKQSLASQQSNKDESSSSSQQWQDIEQTAQQAENQSKQEDQPQKQDSSKQDPSNEPSLATDN